MLSLPHYRPFLAGCVRFAGFEARLGTAMPVEGRRRFRRLLLGSRGSDIAMSCDDEEITLPFAEVQKAKLVLTDELIAASRQADGPTDAAGAGKDERREFL